jgi:3-oxoacyl-[acyl-carrier protein] reductase
MITADLTGKAALVTGGGSGIGLATVELLLACGATVAVNHLPDDARAKGEVERLRAAGGKVVAAPGDVARPGEAEEMVRAAIDGLGGLDILVNNAGTPGTTAPIAFADLDAMTEKFWQTILATNLLGPFRCSHAAAPALKRARGAIVNTASVAGLGRVGSSIAYGASKAGLVSLTRSLAVALAPEIRVNAVAPGFVDSPWTKAWPEERKAGYVGQTLMKRACTPADIAEAILFLAAGGAMITGQTLPVEGGLI